MSSSSSPVAFLPQVESVETNAPLKLSICEASRMCLGTRLAHQHDLDETHPTQNKLHSPLQLVLMFD
jgi:hypothetical protein